jgi:flagellar motor switch protein FliN
VIPPPEGPRNVAAPADQATIDDMLVAPLSDLPQLRSSQMRFERRTRGLAEINDLARRLLPGIAIKIGAGEVTDRPTGINRPGVIAQLAWPRLDTRIGVGIETLVAHALVDQLLGFERLPAENYRQITPVEFGVLTFLLARSLDRLDASAGPFGPWDLVIDRVGTDPFDSRDLGAILTWRWFVQIGQVSGSIRLWLPESILNRLEDRTPARSTPRPGFSSLSSTWHAEAATITLPRGLGRLKVGVVLPIGAGDLRGKMASPEGPITLVCRDRDGRSWFEVEAVPGSAAARVMVRTSLRREPIPREPTIVNPSPSPAPSAPADLPVTLVVELGRVNLALSRLADLKPGDVVELGRHSREPVELTSNGKLVARGELVQIDTELGVRITNILM